MKAGDSLHTKIVGVTKRNDCGEKIQDILEEISDFAEGKLLELEHEEDNPYDKNAIKVFYSNEHIGYINRELASEIAPLVDQEQIEAEICQITGGDGLSYGCNILLRVLPAGEETSPASHSSYSPPTTPPTAPIASPVFEKNHHQKSFKGLYILAAVLIVCLAAAFIIFTQSEERSPAAGSTSPLASSSTSSSEEADENELLKETVRSLADDSFPAEAITDVRVSDAQAEIFVRNSAVSIGLADMESTAQQVSALIREDLAPRNVVVYIQDDAENNLLTVINGRTTFSAGADNTASGQNPPTITLAEFNAIQEGMTYQEVTDIVGSSGELISETDIGIPEYYTQMRSWEGEGLLGANANVIFQGGVVTSKAQFGLE